MEKEWEALMYWNVDTFLSLSNRTIFLLCYYTIFELVNTVDDWFMDGVIQYLTVTY